MISFIGFDTMTSDARSARAGMWFNTSRWTRVAITALCVGVMGAANLALAGDVEDGWAAFNRKDYVTAVGFWARSAQQGNAAAQNNVGTMYRDGIGVPRNYAEAIRLYKLAADQGDRLGQVNLGAMHEMGLGVPLNYAEALRLFRLAAGQGEAEAQFRLGAIYQQGRGVLQNDAEAARFYKLAAAQAHADARVFLGWMNENGKGVPQNYTEAIRLYKLAASQGNASAHNYLGLMYQKGLGVPKNDAEAARLFKLAADRGDAGAQASLGWAYADGRGVANNDAEAVRLFKLSADQGNAGGQNNLGWMYERGRGVPQNFHEAIRLYKLAAAQDFHAAKANLTRLSSFVEYQGCTPSKEGPNRFDIALEKEAGTFVVSVQINNAITLKFTVDSGASDVTIPADVVMTLMRTGTIQSSDFLGTKTYQLADGSTAPSQTFRIRVLKVGNHEIENVTGSIAKVEGSLLLGQSFLGRFNSWSIDNVRHVLVLNSGVTPSPPTADQIYNDAFKKLQDGDYAGAEKGFRTFAQCNPQHGLAGNAQYWLGETYYARRDYQNAMTAFAEGYKTYKASPKGPDNLLKLGVTLANLGRKPDACAIFVRFAQDYPRATDLQKGRIEQERQKNGCV